MARFKKAIITEKGLALINKVQTGSVNLEFTKISTGEGDYADSEDLTKATALKKKRQDFALSSIEVIDNDTVKIRTVIGNQGLESGYYIKEIGLYATDPDEGEILYSLAVAYQGQWDYLPSEAEMKLATITLDTFSSVANASTVTIQGGTGAYASAADLENLAEKLQEHIDTGPIVVIEENIPASARKAGHWYFYVTMKQTISGGSADGIKAGPNMGLEIIEE